MGTEAEAVVTEEEAGVPELTPEQRDEQTVARAFGVIEDKAEEEEEDGDDDSSDAADEDGAEDADKDSTEEDSDEEDLPEITDEDVANFIEAVGLDRLLGNEKVKTTVESTTQRIARERAEAEAAKQSVAQAEAALIETGGKALASIVTSVNKVSETLEKIKSGEIDGLDLNVSLNPQQLQTDLRAVVASTGALVRREWDDAFSNSFLVGMETIGLKGLSPEEAETIQKIASTANDLEKKDVSKGGGSAAAKAHLFGEAVKFLVSKADKTGYDRALAEVASKRSALKKVVGDNSVKAAVAKVQKARAKLPPKPAPGATAPSGGISISAYQAAKKAGDVNEINRITNEIARLRAMGSPIPD